MFDPEAIEQGDLRGGRPPWLAGLEQPVRKKPDRSMRCDVLVVGAGITGSLVAEHLTPGSADADPLRLSHGLIAAAVSVLVRESMRSSHDFVCLARGPSRPSHSSSRR